MPPGIEDLGAFRCVNLAYSTYLRPRKALGQNFLRDDNIARKIVASLDARREDSVLEIGPGEGALTKRLAGKCGSLTVVDVDRRVVELMERMFAASMVEVLHADFLSLDLDAFAQTHPGRLRVLGNIPYNITSPILFHVLDNRSSVVDLLIMVQKEVGQRMASRPGNGDYGILSVFCGYCAHVEILFDVSPNAFYPKPQVTSTVVHLTMRASSVSPARDEQFFRAMVRAAFGKRRKTLRNSLRYFCEPRGIQLPDLLVLDRRPEELSIQELVELSDTLLLSTGNDDTKVKHQ